MALTTFRNKAYKERMLLVKKSNLNLFLPVIVTSLIVIAVIIFITNYSLRQSGRVIGHQIAERGKLTILLYESIALGAIDLEHFIDEKSLIRSLGNQKGFKFLAITDANGKVIAHNNADKTDKRISIHSRGEQVNSFQKEIKRLLPNTDREGTDWGFVEVNKEQLFIVHRVFGESWKKGQSEEKSLPKNRNLKLNQDKKHIFAAIKPETLHQAIAAYRKQSFIMALQIIFVSLVFLCFSALIYSVFTNKKRMSAVEEIIIIMHDEVQRLEFEIQKQEKLAIIGNLAAGVAHEIRNPLSSIKGYVTYFASVFPEGSQNQKVAHIMIAEVERLNRVIGDLIGVSRPTDIKTEQISVFSIINSTVQLLSQDARQLGIQLNVYGTDVIANIDPDRLKQALLNIILNALESFKESDVSTQVEAASISIILSEIKGYFRIQVVDNGAGIDKTTLKRIFDPYFTTKSQGTGLGLVNSSKIIEAHGGSISVLSEKSLGTTFTIQIPKNL